MDSLFNRYGLALLDIAIEEKRVDEYRTVVKEIDKCLKENDDYIRVLSSSFISKKEKISLIEEAFGTLNFKHIINFLKIIIENHREDVLIKILEQFVSLCNDRLGILEGIVYSVNYLNESQISSIESVIGDKLGKRVELKNILDPGLIGGVKVIVNDRIYDGSINSKIDNMKQSLLTKKGEEK